MDARKIWTIGHSTNPIERFVALLKSFEVDMICDIRRFPGSKRFPQFNGEVLIHELGEQGIRYVHMEALGGRRSPKKDSKNTGWRNSAFRGYADYMETGDFKRGVMELESLASAQNVAMMCSEAVWWSCHRSLVSDYLKHRGWIVMHIMGVAKNQEHPWTSPARIKEDKLVYVADGTLDL